MLSIAKVVTGSFRTRKNEASELAIWLRRAHMTLILDLQVICRFRSHGAGWGIRKPLMGHKASASNVRSWHITSFAAAHQFGGSRRLSGPVTDKVEPTGAIPAGSLRRKKLRRSRSVGYEYEVRCAGFRHAGLGGVVIDVPGWASPRRVSPGEMYGEQEHGEHEHGGNQRERKGRGPERARDPGYVAAAARPLRCGRQEADPQRQEARLRHP